MENDLALRQQLVSLMTEGNAHATYDRAIEGLAPALRGVRPAGLEHSAWELVEHLRTAQWDILDFSRNSEYQELKWPDDYWPSTAAPPSETAWDESIAAFHRDLQAMCALVMDPATDLFAKIPWGSGQTILREALLVADHNAYHVGQIVLVRQLLGDWK
jgi:hypothetical protein